MEMKIQEAKLPVFNEREQAFIHGFWEGMKTSAIGAVMLQDDPDYAYDLCMLALDDYMMDLEYQALRNEQEDGKELLDMSIEGHM